MQYPAILCATLALATCSAHRGARSTRADSSAEAPARELQTIVEFLLTAAATDFHAHPPSEALRFRDVRVARVVTASGTEQYMLCGQFLPASDTGDWTPFSTIKTSDYEQWIGAQAAGVCQGSSVRWEKVGDLSSSLQSRLASLR
jgi:hypothetical protein